MDVWGNAHLKCIAHVMSLTSSLQFSHFMQKTQRSFVYFHLRQKPTLKSTICTLKWSQANSPRKKHAFFSRSALWILYLSSCILRENELWLHPYMYKLILSTLRNISYVNLWDKKGFCFIKNRLLDVCLLFRLVRALNFVEQNAKCWYVVLVFWRKQSLEFSPTCIGWYL